MVSKKVMKEMVCNRLRQADVFPDKLILKKDGSFEFRRGFFYRHGQTTEKYANAIKQVFPRATIVESFENWQPWPRDSYFMVRFKLPEDQVF